MATKELLFYIDQICKDKGLERDVVLKSIEAALLSAAKKIVGTKKNLKLNLNPETCEINIYAIKEVVEDVKNPQEEISLEEAKKIDPQAEIGQQIEIPIKIEDFGRISAQTAKQVILQKIREAEKSAVYDEFKDKVGKVVSGSVLRKERGIYFLKVGRAEAKLPVKETLPNERLKQGDIVKAYVKEIRPTSKGPEIWLSRTTPEFVKELFRMEVPEVEDGIIEILKVAREPGERSKILVRSKDPSVDPVGACVGMKGTRVQTVVRELRGERIDIIPWTEEPTHFIAKALTPATIEQIGVNPEEKTALVIVSDEQLPQAIGRRGQNVKLAMKLTGWQIDILSESEYARLRQQEAEENSSE
ncbi:MAG: transcription termination/antitermination protein NusA [Nitrospirae bacterium]|nr:MAG: transcription termination/antitermination protein NusA [Nitrospirota bacterium]